MKSKINVMLLPLTELYDHKKNLFSNPSIYLKKDEITMITVKKRLTLKLMKAKLKLKIH